MGEEEVLATANSSASEHDSLYEELQKTKEALWTERRRSLDVMNEMRRLKERNLAVQKQVEQEEEFITNTLMKRLKQAKDEKQKLANACESEEEYLVNNLQKRLHKITTEKIDLEMQLQIELDIETKLKSSVEEMKEKQRLLTQEKVDLENQLEAEQEYIVNKLHKQVEDLTKEKLDIQEQRKGLLKERDVLLADKAELRRSVCELAASAEHLTQEKFKMEALKEMEEEQISNRLQRQIEYLMSYIKQAGQALEKKGIILNELVPLQLDSTAEETYGRSPTYRTSSAGSSRRSSGIFAHPSLGSPSGSLFMPSIASAPTGSLRSPDFGMDQTYFRQRIAAGRK